MELAKTTYGQESFEIYLASDGSDAGKSYYFKIAAINGLGEGEISDPILVVASCVPDAPIMLKRNNDLSSRTVLSFTWNEGSSNGGTAVIDYRVSFD